MSRHCTPGTTYIAKKHFDHWYGLMKTYYEKNEVKCRVAETPVDVPPNGHAFKQFPTGSTYDGDVDIIGMSGYGEYTLPNGVMYRGQLVDGVFHGFGELVYEEGPEKGSVIQGEWNKGILSEPKIMFNGTLEYKANDWMYCLMPDRRYAVEYETELRPAGQSLITPEDPPRKIPDGFYDAGDGFYNPRTRMICNYEKEIEVKRAPAYLERRWILENCRKAPMEQLGPRQDLYEEWNEPVVEPAPIPAPLTGYKMKSPPSSEQNIESVPVEEVEKGEKPIFYDSSLYNVKIV